MQKFTGDKYLNDTLVLDRENELERKESPVLSDAPQGFPFFQDKIGKTAISILPETCRPWSFHNRDIAWLTTERCADLISSIEKYGQHQPILVRPLLNDPNYKYEIIYGVRRWFACSNIPNQKLWAYVADLDDKACTILMHTENANSKDITEFERACSFAQQLKSKIFKSQLEMADALGLSQGTISKMVRASEIFDHEWLRVLFNNKLDIPIKYAYMLSVYLKKTELLSAIIQEAKRIMNEREAKNAPQSSSAILKRLINTAQSNQKNPTEAVILAFEDKPIISCKRDKFGKVHIVINQEARSFSTAELQAACLEAINMFVFN